jgi:opacity protein-like surface antigen
MADPHQLEPLELGTPRGVGLSLGAVPGVVARAWNADVYTTWSFLKSFSLYGRLGYAQNDASTSYAAAAQSPVDARLFRDGMNYGVGVRYDITRALGLRLEYARFPRFVGESVTGPLPDSDQVQFGMQFSF